MKLFDRLRLIVIFCFVFVLTNCQEDYENSQNHTESSESRMNYKSFNDFKNLSGLIKEAIPDYKGGIKKSNDSLDIYQFEIDSTQVAQVISNKGVFYTMPITRKINYEVDIFENLVVCDRGAVKEAYLIRYLPDEEYYQRIKTNIHAGFSGGVNVYKLDDSRLTKSINCTELTITYCNWDPNGGENLHVAGPNCGHIVYTFTITLCTRTPDFVPTGSFEQHFSFVNINPGISGGGGGGKISGLGTVSQPYTPIDSGDGGYNPVNSTNPGFGLSNGDSPVFTGPIIPSKSPDAIKIEDEITSENIDDCSGGVLEQLKELTDKDIAKIITKLDANPSPYKLEISTENNGTGNPANTIRRPGHPKHDYLMRLNPDIFGPDAFSPSTKLFRASIILHEVVHAYFLSLVDDVEEGVPGASEEMSELFQKYVEKNFGPDALEMHHQIMAEKYVDIIARAIQEYNTGTPVLGNPEQIYTDLAWGGLQDASIFNTTSQLTATDRVRIAARYSSEGYNRTVGDQVPEGQPCE